MKKRLKSFINYGIIIGVFIFFVIYMLMTEGIDNIIKAFANLNYGWILACLVCMLIYWFCESKVLEM